jgi:hypothetical protein
MGDPKPYAGDQKDTLLLTLVSGHEQSSSTFCTVNRVDQTHQSPYFVAKRKENTVCGGYLYFSFGNQYFQTSIFLLKFGN